MSNSKLFEVSLSLKSIVEAASSARATSQIMNGIENNTDWVIKTREVSELSGSGNRNTASTPGATPTAPVIVAGVKLDALEYDYQTLANAPTLNGEYQMIVVFNRSIPEDLEIIKNRHPGKPIKEALALQLKDELQHAADQGILAGSYVIEIPETLDKLVPALEKEIVNA